MCKHIINCMTYIKTDCCREWFECSECHDERHDHEMKTSTHLKFTCKACWKVFDRDLTLFTNKDKHCGECGVLWCLPGIH
jgi:uncharacterized CHY-type Zn-finger protein